MTVETLSLREAQKALTRSRIIDAARTAFEQKGYAGASIGLITRQAAINRATFYLHFPDKAAVFREVVALDRMRTDEYWRDLNATLMKGTREAFEDWIEGLTHWARDNASLMASKHEAMASDPEFAKEFQPRYDRLANQITEYLATFPARDRGDQKIRVQMLVVMLDQMFFHAFVQGVWAGSEKQLLRVATDVCCRALDID